MILLIDNYDSFTYNLYQYLGEIGQHVRVCRNDQISLDEIEKLKPEGLVISPGPGRPKDAGISLALIKTFFKTTPILGVCLGHQSIGEAFGADIVYASALFHGKPSQITHDQQGVFEGLEPSLVVGRYHSLVIQESSLPAELKISARTADNVIMGVRHTQYLTEGIQFHPESYLSPDGKQMLRNFVKNMQSWNSKKP